MIAMGLGLAIVLVPLQAVLGDSHGLNTLEHQPQKLAAIEGIWETRTGNQPTVLFAIPDEEAESNHDRDRDSQARRASTSRTTAKAASRGCSDFPAPRSAAGRARVLRVPRSWSAMWTVMLLITVWGWLARVSQARLHDRALSCARARGRSRSGYVAVTAGWVTTEVGRQPWVVYNYLRTADAVTPHLTGRDVDDLACARTLWSTRSCSAPALYYLVQAGPASDPPRCPRRRSHAHQAAGTAAVRRRRRLD